MRKIIIKQLLAAAVVNDRNTKPQSLPAAPSCPCPNHG